MRNRTLRLTDEEELELKDLMEAGVLNPICEEYGVTSYREAYFIYKGKITPGFQVDNAPITRWF